MAYSTATNVKAALLGVASYSYTDDAIALFIAKADALIDGYLANVYTVPFTTTPALINSMSVDIAVYYILRTSYTNDRIEKEENSFIFEWYNKAISNLKKLASGEMSLGASYLRSTNLIISDDENYTSTADIDDVENWNRSNTRLEDIEDARDAD